MRLPFNFEEPKIDDRARVKFTFNSPELHQNIEISIDGNETSLETLLDAFQRFLGALGICIPENVNLGFIEFDNEDEKEDEEDTED